MKDHPLVTIGIPNYNYSDYIVETLNSVVSQTYQNIELIIVDDLSTDNSIQIINDWINNYKGSMQINFIKNNCNLGLTKACNIILENANGKYFQPLDADDIILPNKIEKQVQLLEYSLNTAFVYSNVAVINENGEVTNPDYCKRINYDKNDMPSGNIFNDLLEFNFISLPSVLINTELGRKAGGFDETLHVQDYYMWLKLSQKNEVMYLPETTAYYRIHPSSMSNAFWSSCVSEESVMVIKQRYFNECNNKLKKIIATNVQNSSIFLYKHKYPSSKKWLSIAFKLNPGFKTLLYFIAVRMHVQYSFFEKVKQAFCIHNTDN